MRRLSDNQRPPLIKRSLKVLSVNSGCMLQGLICCMKVAFKRRVASRLVDLYLLREIHVSEQNDCPSCACFGLSR